MKYNPEGSNPSKLCGICSNQKTCPRNASERYYGYHGAYRCLTEGAGDVAFVSHLSVFDFTGLENDLNPGEDFGLLCPDGNRKGKVKVNYVRGEMAGVVSIFVWPCSCLFWPCPCICENWQKLEKSFRKNGLTCVSFRMSWESLRMWVVIWFT